MQRGFEERGGGYFGGGLIFGFSILVFNMARTISQIQQSIIDAKNADATLSGLTSTSLTAKWLLWTYIIAVCQWTLELLYDAHKAEVQGIIDAGKAHTLRWYVLKAKAYQYGYSLPVDAGDNATSDVYTTIDASAQVVAFAAAVEITPLNIVRIKTARLVGGSLAPLTALQRSGLITYMQEIKDAGVRLNITSAQGDNLQLKLSVYYDATVLDSTGAGLAAGSSATPVKDAITSFLASLPFNGVLILDELRNAILAVDGVVLAVVELAQANYASTPYVEITGQYIPDAGYLVLDGTYFDGGVSYTAYTVTDI